MGRSIGLSVVFVVAFAQLSAADWPRFRGPGGLGIAEEGSPPARWSEDEGVAWRVDLPGPGSSSPIVSGDRVFVTCYSGYGVEGGGDMEDLTRHVVCVDLASGKILWRSSDKSSHNVTRAGSYGIGEHHYASSTPVTDGYRVYAFFGSSGVVAYDFSGVLVWKAKVSDDPATNRFGSASSPILYKELVIVPATVEAEAIIAFDRKTGKETWRAPATGYGGAWTTPIVANVAGDEQELIVNLPDEVWGLNPENGKLRWYAESRISGGPVCPSAVADKGLVYATGGRGGRTVAIRLGGRGDVTESHLAWSANAGSYVPSPLVHDGYLYWANDQGIAYCVNAKTGETAYRQRLENAGDVYASVLKAGDRLYVVTRRNGTIVLASGPEFKVVARNELASDRSDFNASPAVAGDRLLLRSNRRLYCIGGERKASGD